MQALENLKFKSRGLLWYMALCQRHTRLVANAAATERWIIGRDVQTRRIICHASTNSRTFHSVHSISINQTIKQRTN